MALIDLRTPDTGLQRQALTQQLLGQAADRLTQTVQANRQREALAQLLGGTPAEPGQSPAGGQMAQPGTAGILQTGQLTPQQMQAFLLAGGNPETLLSLLPKPQAPIKVGAGDVLLDPATMQPLFQAPAEQKPLSTLGKIASDLGIDLNTPEGFQRAVQVMQQTQAPGATVNVGTGQIDPLDQPIPVNELRALQAPGGTPLPVGTTYRQASQMGVIPIDAAQAQAEQQQAQEQAARREQQQTTMADIVGQDIQRALALSEQALTTGAVGQVLSGIGGTAARDLSALVDTIRANVGFQQLQQMREASPTGGALGQVSENENRLLQSVLGSLEQSQSREQFQFNLKRLHNITMDIVHGPGNGPQRFDLGEGELEQTGPMDFSSMTLEELTALDPSNMTPEELRAAAARFRELGGR